MLYKALSSVPSNKTAISLRESRRALHVHQVESKNWDTGEVEQWETMKDTIGNHELIVIGCYEDKTIIYCAAKTHSLAPSHSLSEPGSRHKSLTSIRYEGLGEKITMSRNVYALTPEQCSKHMDRINVVDKLSQPTLDHWHKSCKGSIKLVSFEGNKVVEYRVPSKQITVVENKEDRGSLLAHVTGKVYQDGKLVDAVPLEPVNWKNTEKILKKEAKSLQL